MFVCHSAPDTLYCLSLFVSPFGLPAQLRLSDTGPGALPFGRYPPQPCCTRQHPDLPSSRATPLSTCPGLRPRRCPGHLPFRFRDCCLPLHQKRRLSFYNAELILTVRNYTFFGALYRACTLAPSGFRLPLPGLPADFATEPAATLCSGGTLVSGDHPLGNSVEFHLHMETPNDSGFAGRDEAVVRCILSNAMYDIVNTS